MYNTDFFESNTLAASKQVLWKTEIFQTRVLYIVEDALLMRREFTYYGIRFSCVTIEESMQRIREVRPAFLLVSFNLADQLSAYIDSLQNYATEHAVPIILYSQYFEKLAKNFAISYHFDDYYFGNLSPKFLKRLSFLKKLKKYKIRHHGKFVSGYRWHMNQLLFIAKRSIDIIMASTILVLLSPLMLVIAAIIKLESKGPVFYAAKRAGNCYKVFDFYKFRSMRAGADKELTNLLKHNQYGTTFFKMKDDPRVTKFGSFLRCTSLDELPQLFNVLKGDMSIVGNRPLPLYEARLLTKDKTASRFLAPAGITGLWQILKRGKAEMSDEERIELDIEYSRNCSLALDIKILLKTIPALMQKERV